MYTIEDIKIKLLDGDYDALLESLDNYNIDEFDSYGNNILHYYIKNAEAMEIDPYFLFPELIKRGLDINTKQSKQDECSPLFLAVTFREQELVSLLIELGAQIDSQDINGNTPLLRAVFNYRNDDSFFIEVLLQHGANPNLENNYEVSPKSLSETIANYDSKGFFN